MTATYLERLAARSVATGTVLCLGLDPDPDALPPGFSPDLRGVEAFARLLLEAAAPYAAAVKPSMLQAITANIIHPCVARPQSR